MKSGMCQKQAVCEGEAVKQSAAYNGQNPAFLVENCGLTKPGAG